MWIPANIHGSSLIATFVLSDLIVKVKRNFHQMLSCSQMVWSHIRNEEGPTITDRFSHSACYFHQSMYVFGGCSATSTTFNDLWRFDLSTRQWVRPLAMGRCCSVQTRLQYIDRGPAGQRSVMDSVENTAVTDCKLRSWLGIKERVFDV